MHGDTKCPEFYLKTCNCEGVQFEKKSKIIKLGQNKKNTLSSIKFSFTRTAMLTV